MSENLLNLVNTIRDRKNKDEDKSYTSHYYQVVCLNV